MARARRGAGCAATVGKALGGDFCMKTGIGSYAVQVGDVKVGAVVVVNALGDVRDPKTGETVAGLLAEDKRSFRSTEEVLYAMREAAPGAVTNTTIGAILTNANLNKAQLCKVAGMAQDGLAHAIYPVHTSMDGDSVYALSTCEVASDTDLVGMLAADVMAEAILVAARSAAPAFGLSSAASLR